ERASKLLEDARPGVPLGPMTTYRVGGRAELFLEVNDERQLARVATAVKESGVPVLVIGRGSNLLVSDAGFTGLASTFGGSFGEDAEVGPGRLALGYRSSSVRPDQVVAWAEFALEAGVRETSEAQIADIVRWRRENQPGGSNAGSVFTNPPDDSAGRLIDAAGLKGHRRGSACVSPKHANFFQADEGGSADDVRELVLEVQRLVEERMGIRL